jgi:hypothetical protein
MGYKQKGLRFAGASLTAICLLALGAGAAAALTSGASANTPDCTATPGGGNLCVLNPTAANAFVAAGSATMTVARDLVVNSSSAGAASASDGSSVSAAAIGGPGGFSTSNGGSFSPTPVHIAAQPDPFAGATVAHGSCSGGSALTVLSGSQSANAGTYSTLGAGGTGTLNLNPGVYTITTSFGNTSGGTITGTGVTLYFCAGAGLSLGGTSSTTLSSPTGSSGFVIFFDPTSTGSFTTDAIKGQLVGAVYAKSASLQLHNLSVEGDVVADTVNNHSGGVVTITSGPTPPPPTTTTTTTTKTTTTTATTTTATTTTTPTTTTTATTTTTPTTTTTATTTTTPTPTPTTTTAPFIPPAVTTTTAKKKPPVKKLLAAKKVVHKKAVKKPVQKKAVKHVTKKAKVAVPVVKAAHFTG